MVFHVLGLCFTNAIGTPAHHQVWLVVLAYVIAACGSYTTLDIGERLRGASGVRGHLWLAGSAATLGGTIWAMHFTALLALRLSLPVSFDLAVTISSLLVAIAFAAVGLQIARYRPLSAPRLCLAGLIVGLGIATMHYVGMSALRLPGLIAYRPGLWGLSILIAVAAATASLWLALSLHATWHRAVAALVMALAICGMHFVGMQATEFLLDPDRALPEGIAAGPLAVGLAGLTFALFLLVIVSVSAERRLFAAYRREADGLRAANVTLQATQREIIRRLCLAGEFRDSDTGAHVERIGLMAHRLALASGCDQNFATMLRAAAPLHDIGKIGISDLVLLKPGNLDRQERAEIETHTLIGYQILSGSGVPLLDLAAEIARSHHERWDGTGYPDRLSGLQIPLCSRIVAIVDVFDALLSTRPYKQPWPLDSVVALIRNRSGQHFDPTLVAAFFGVLDAMVAIRDGLEDQTSLLIEPVPDGPDAAPVDARRYESDVPAAHAAAEVRPAWG